MSERLVALARLGPGDTVLDVGTGLGEPALTAARAVAPAGRVVGLDVSPAMIELARERAKREGVENVEYHVTDVASGISGGPFDAVVSRWGIMFFADIDAALARLRATMRTGGIFAAATWGAPGETPLISLPLAMAAQPGDAPPELAGGPFALSDPADLERRFTAAGYSNVAVESFEVLYTFGSASDYFEHVSGRAPPVIALLKRLDDDARAKLRVAVERRVDERFTVPGGAVRIPNRALIISAVNPG